MHSKRLRVLYWSLTLLFLLPQVWSASQMLIEAPRMTATITGLGYPVYVMKILGVAKLLGALAIVFGGFAGLSALKEWAYAGFTFDVIGAFFSHVSAGDPLFPIALMPLLFLAVQFASYVLWKQLGASQPTAHTQRIWAGRHAGRIAARRA